MYCLLNLISSPTERKSLRDAEYDFYPVVMYHTVGKTESRACCFLDDAVLQTDYQLEGMEI